MKRPGLHTVQVKVINPLHPPTFFPFASVEVFRLRDHFQLTVRVLIPSSRFHCRVKHLAHRHATAANEGQLMFFRFDRRHNWITAGLLFDKPHNPLIRVQPAIALRG